MRDMTAERAVARVASAVIGEYADVDETQVRKDMASLGVRGVPRVGFKTSEVMEAIRRVLGFAGPHRAIVIGAGRLGSAIAAYPGFAEYGLSIVALIDLDPDKVGLEVSGNRVQPVERMEFLVERLDARLAILTVPAEAAQDLADRAVRAGIRAIWSFAPANVTVPRRVALRHEHLSVGLAVLTHGLSGSGPGS